MVISDSNVMQALGGRTNNVGSINGEDITYKDFQAALDQQRELRKQSGQEIDDESLDQFRDEVWEYIISQILIKQQVQKLGITVSDEEVREIILGDEPPAFLKQNFIDSLGNFNRDFYENALFDPQNEQALIGAEESVRQYRLNEKLQSMIIASVNVSEDEVLRKFKDQNIYVNDAECSLIGTGFIPDSTVELTDDDIRKYYDESIERYTVKAQRKLKFVIFGNQPSRKDSELVFEDLQYVKSNFETEDTTDFQYYVDIYSSQPYSVDTLTLSSFKPEAIDILKSSDVGDIIGPVSSQEGVTIYHLLGKVATDDVMASASHILINANDDDTNLIEANRIYDELIGGGDFEQLAIEHSGDRGSGRRGDSKIGEIQKPVKTTFGYHIIKVNDRSNNKFIVEKIVNPIKQSATTRDERYNAANDFSYLADKNGFEKEAQLMNYNIQESGNFAENDVSIPGIGVNKRLVQFAFENGLNALSDVYKVQQGYLVAYISEVNESGIKSFDEVKEEIKPSALMSKKLEKTKVLADDLHSKLNGDLKKITEFDPRYTVKNTGRFNAETNIPGIGRNYSFIETAMNSEPNVITKPVKVSTGHYLIKVISKSPFDSTAYSMQSSTIRNNLLQQKKQLVVSQWLKELKERAEIVDNRYLFYGY
jgi:parvulin-like peptidyl-prolyl isomerase